MFEYCEGHMWHHIRIVWISHEYPHAKPSQKLHMIPAGGMKDGHGLWLCLFSHPVKSPKKSHNKWQQEPSTKQPAQEPDQEKAQEAQEKSQDAASLQPSQNLLQKSGQEGQSRIQSSSQKLREWSLRMICNYLCTNYLHNNNYPIPAKTAPAAQPSQYSVYAQLQPMSFSQQLYLPGPPSIGTPRSTSGLDISLSDYLCSLLLNQLQCLILSHSQWLTHLYWLNLIDSLLPLLLLKQWNHDWIRSDTLLFHLSCCLLHT